MTRYTDELTLGDDFDDQIHDLGILRYREGVDRVLTYIESINAFPKLVSELRWSIKEGII